MTWIREGTCCKCGDCCDGNPNPGLWEDAPDGMCPLLGLLQKDGTRLCTGHDGHPFYLQGCNVWPSIPEHVARFSRCSYTWRWAE